MFAVFVSKAFLKHIFEESNQNSDLFDMFYNDFFSKLNVSKLICDFDILNDSSERSRKLVKAFMKDGVPFFTTTVPTPIEEMILNNFNELTLLGLSDFKNLYFIHLPANSIYLHKHLNEASVISSINFEDTFSKFLINGRIEDECPLLEYFDRQSDFNPLACLGTEKILIDDSFFLIKKHDKKYLTELDKNYYEKQVSEFTKRFLNLDSNRATTLIFLVPTYDYDDRKLSWSKPDQEIIRQLTIKTVESAKNKSKTFVFFHPLKTHSRRILTNRHFYKMDIGFDWIKTYDTDKSRLDETNDSIEFKSIYIKNKTLTHYIEKRIADSETKAIRYFA